jgi:hypothetical protein
MNIFQNLKNKERRILPMTKSDQQRITHHKRFVPKGTHLNFCFFYAENVSGNSLTVRVYRQ